MPHLEEVMTKKRTPATRGKPAAEERPAVTAERFTRLYRMLQILAGGPQTRDRLARQLGLDVRGFYRDLELLRSVGIHLTLNDGRYRLEEDLARAVTRLPFPDPHLTFGEVLQLAKGRSAAHRQLEERLRELLP